MKTQIIAFIDSAAVSPRTRAVLRDRLTTAGRTPQFFTEDEYSTLQMLIGWTLPQTRTEVDIAASIDRRLAQREGLGWRFADLPADPDAYRIALRLIAEHLQSRQTAGGFADGLDYLEEIQQQKRDTAGLILSKWFEGFKVEVVRCWLASPQAMAQIDYRGFADELLLSQSPETGQLR